MALSPPPGSYHGLKACRRALPKGWNPNASYDIVYDRRKRPGLRRLRDATALRPANAERLVVRIGQPQKRAAAECRAKAVECRELAGQVSTKSHKAIFLEMAETWDRLAEDTEKRAV